MRGKQFALSAGVLAMVVFAGAPTEAGDVADGNAPGAVGTAKTLYRTIDGKTVNLQPRRVATRPPLPRRRPVSLPGRDLADAATLGTGKTGADPAGGPDPAGHPGQAKDVLDATASYDGSDASATKGGNGNGEESPSRLKVNFKAKY